MKIINFTAASGNEYELHVEGETHIRFISEKSDGKIYDPEFDNTWDSLADMTHALKIEIVDWGSDVGD